MIKGIEELCPELEALFFADGENLKQRHIPVLKAWSSNDVSIRVAKSAQDRVGRKGARVKQCCRHARLRVGISHNVGPRCTEDKSAAIGVGEIGGDVGRRKPVSSGRGRDSGDLPIANDLVQNAGSISSNRFVLAKGQLVGVAENEAVADIKVGVPVLQTRVVLVAEITLILGSQTGARSVVESVALGV